MATLKSYGNFLHLESTTSNHHKYVIDSFLLKEDTNIELDRDNRIYITSRGKNYYFDKDEFTYPVGLGAEMSAFLYELASLGTNSSLPKKSAYGEMTTSKSLPIAVGNAVYGFIPSNFRTYTAGTGTADTESNYFKVFSGTSLADYGAIRSFRSVNHKTGQGVILRFSARFPENEANTWSGVGGVNVGDELSFGYNGTSFGIWHRYNGKQEVRVLQITGAAGGSENATVFINGVEYTIPLTAGTVQHNAFEIAEWIKNNVTIIEAEQVDDTVYIDFLSDGAKSGTYSFSSSTATGTWTQQTAGVTKTSVHIPMANWNVLKNGFSDFNPYYGNNYEIKYQNGYGNINFYIENHDTGDYDLVHVIKWTNVNGAPNLGNPSLRMGMYATALGNITGVSVEVPYMAGFINGDDSRTRNPRSIANTKSIATTLTNIITLRNSRIFNGFANQVEIEPIYLTLSNDGGKTALFQIINNATIGGETNFQSTGTKLVGQTDTAGTTVTGGTLIATFSVAKGNSIDINLTPFFLRQPASLSLTIAGNMYSGAASELSVTLTYYEDI